MFQAPGSVRLDGANYADLRSDAAWPAGSSRFYRSLFDAAGGHRMARIDRIQVGTKLFRLSRCLPGGHRPWQARPVPPASTMGYAEKVRTQFLSLRQANLGTRTSPS